MTWWRASTVVGLLFLNGCLVAGAGPDARRVRPNDNSGYWPQGKIHFVENEVRSKGVLISASAGGHNAFNVYWSEVVVPLPPTTIRGPVWSGRKPTNDDAIAWSNLPKCRHCFDLNLEADVVRRKYGQSAAWILGTHPFMVGLTTGDPQRSWQEFATAETGRGAVMQLKMYTARFVVADELSQPLTELVVFPTDFFEDESRRYAGQVEPSIIVLKSPMTIDATLDAIAAGGLEKLGLTTKSLTRPVPTTDPLEHDRMEEYSKFRRQLQSQQKD